MKRLFPVLIVLIVLFLSANKISACMCANSPTLTVKISFLFSDAAFSGKFISSGKETKKVEVTKVWKGTVEEEIYVVDVSAGSSCDLGFKKGEERMFFVSQTSESEASEKYKNIKSPIREKNLQVFFASPCTLLPILSNWENILIKYDKENFWQTVGEGSLPIREEKRVSEKKGN